MTYSKPQLLGYKAVAVIQSGSMFKNGSHNELGTQNLTIPAYEADE